MVEAIMDLSIDWPSPSLRIISPDCQDTVASTTSSAWNSNYAPAAGRSATTASPHRRTPRLSRHQQLALQEQRRILTEEIILLKFNIATQRGRQDELQLEWRKLRPERNAMQLELEYIEQECETLQKETMETRDRVQESSLRLRKLTSTAPPEQQTIDQVTNDFIAIHSEIQTLQQEKASIQDASKNHSEEIEEYKRHAARISSEIFEIDIERIAVQFDIDDLQVAIIKRKAAIQEYKSATNELDIDISCVKAECDKLGRYIRGLEMKVCAGSKGRRSGVGGN